MSYIYVMFYVSSDGGSDSSADDGLPVHLQYVADKVRKLMTVQCESTLTATALTIINCTYCTLRAVSENHSRTSGEFTLP